MLDSTGPHVYRVSEIRDGVLCRVHGYYASLGGAFAYCEAQERTPSTVAAARFELFPVPGGEQWMIHTYYGPDDPCPEISDLVITRVVVIADAPAGQATPSHRAGLREQLAGALIAWTYRGKEPDPETGILETVRANAYSRADAVLVVLYREWPWLRAEAEDAKPPAEAADRIDRLRPEFFEHASVESIDAQIRRAQRQQRHWGNRERTLAILRQARVMQKGHGEWPAAGERVCKCPAELCACGHHQPAAGARQDGATQ